MDGNTPGAALQLVRDAAPVPVEREFSVQEVKAQVQKIQELMGSLMTEGEHYGKVPGTEKPTLLQPGAQKIAMMFRAFPRYTKEMRDLGGGHREWILACDLYHANGTWLGQGLGSCSTMEGKYRWREDTKQTDVGEVPKAYWAAPRDDSAARQAVLVGIYGAGRYKTKKTADGWRVLRVEGTGQKVENPDLADTYNTVLKIGTKRSLVAAVLCAFAVSDIFTQDLEDLEPDAAPAAERPETGSGEGLKREPVGPEPVPSSGEQPPQSTNGLGDRIKALNQKLTPALLKEFRSDLAKCKTAEEQAELVGQWEAEGKQTQPEPAKAEAPASVESKQGEIF